MQRKFFILLLVCSFCWTVSSATQADSPNSLFRQANEAYMGKAYDTAVQLYEQLVREGYESADLYYNLGNAYYRQEQLAYALLWYERALRLDPGNADIQANIAFVNAQTVDKMEQMPEFFLHRWWNALAVLFSSTGWAVVSIVCCLFFFALLALFLLSSRVERRLRLAVAAFFLLCAVMLSVLFARRQLPANRPEEAIVTAYSVTVKSTPDASGTDLFTVHEGMKVKVTDQVGDWMEVLFPNGNKGWIQQRQVVVI